MKSPVLVHSDASSPALRRPFDRLVRMAPAALLLVGATGVWAGPMAASVAASTPASPIVAWGDNSHGQTTVPLGLGGIAAVAAGRYHSLALKSNGTVVAWGDDTYHQTDVPSGLSGVIAIAAGSDFSLALEANGAVVGWGYSSGGVTTIPTAAKSGVTAMSAGGYHSLALKSNGSVLSWGVDTYHQTDVPTAAQSGVTAVAAGRYHSLALKSDGTVVAWGLDDSHQTDVPAALTSSSTAHVTKIAAGGEHSLALRSDGTVVAWGDDSHAQIDVPAGLSNVTAIAAGLEYSMALEADGTVVVWGQDEGYGFTIVPDGLEAIDTAAGYYHILTSKAPIATPLAWGYGFPGPEPIDVPIDVQGVKAIALGRYEYLALLADGTVDAWPCCATVPAGLADSSTAHVTAIAVGGAHGLALRADGSVVAWGANTSGATTVPAAAQSDVVAIAANGDFNLALLSNGKVVAWGSDGEGETNVPTAAQSGVIAIAAGTEMSLALKADGTLVDWGYVNRHGSQNPPPPAGLSGVKAISSGSGQSIALKADGTASVWGETASVPAGLSGVKMIAAGDNHFLALESDGTLVAWGDNFYGQATVPPGLSDVTEVAAGGDVSVAVAPGTTTTFKVAVGMNPWPAGSTHSVTVTALDAYGNAVTGYRGTVSVYAPVAMSHLDLYTFTAADKGVHTFASTLKPGLTIRTAGSVIVYAIDMNTWSVMGWQTITVTPGPPRRFRVSVGANPWPVGTRHSVTVTAVDVYGNTSPGYTGTVQLTTTDPEVPRPSAPTLTASMQGRCMFFIDFRTPGLQTVTATDTTNPSITGSKAVHVSPGAVTLQVYLGAEPWPVGTFQGMTVIAYDKYGNIAVGYTGTIQFTTSDPQATVPPAYTFTAADKGMHTFPLDVKPGLVFRTTGRQTVTATDTKTPSITGSQNVTVQ